MKRRFGRNCLLAAALVVVMPFASWGRAMDADSAAASRIVVIPFANPLKGFDASTVAWNSVSQVLNASTEMIAHAANWDESVPGRFAYLAMTYYSSYAMEYYSHEMAHCYHQRGGTRHFWVDLSDWSNYVPLFIKPDWMDCYGPGELEEFMYGSDPDFKAEMRRWYVLMGESGLYQNKLNARFLAQASAGPGGTEIANAVSFVMNHAEDVVYNLSSGDEPIEIRYDGNHRIQSDNDITRYISIMSELGATISRDDWLISSALAFAASGQTWNAARAAYRYIAHGERSADNMSWSISDRVAISPPNFYLFPTYRGLYLESETCLGVISSRTKRIHVALGTGLDSFGLQQTGAVDWLRFGGRYDAFPLDLRFIRLSISPYGYADFTSDLKHRGESLGAEIVWNLEPRISLRANVEYNQNDILEGIIKNKDEGMYFLAAVGFDLHSTGSSR